MQSSPNQAKSPTLARLTLLCLVSILISTSCGLVELPHFSPVFVVEFLSAIGLGVFVRNLSIYRVPYSMLGPLNKTSIPAVSPLYKMRGRGALGAINVSGEWSIFPEGLGFSLLGEKGFIPWSAISGVERKAFSLKFAVSSRELYSRLEVPLALAEKLKELAHEQKLQVFPPHLLVTLRGTHSDEDQASASLLTTLDNFDWRNKNARLIAYLHLMVFGASMILPLLYAGGRCALTSTATLGVIVEWFPAETPSLLCRVTTTGQEGEKIEETRYSFAGVAKTQHLFLDGMTQQSSLSIMTDLKVSALLALSGTGFILTCLSQLSFGINRQRRFLFFGVALFTTPATSGLLFFLLDIAFPM